MRDADDKKVRELIDAAVRAAAEADWTPQWIREDVDEAIAAALDDDVFGGPGEVRD